MKRAYRAVVVTVSDKGSRGERIDESGPLVKSELERAGYRVAPVEILSDDRQPLAARLREICDRREAELVVTTGGTGFAPRDCAPEATMDIVERPVPGIPEAMRAKSLEKTDRAVLSRAAAGIRGQTLIVNLPGSPRGAIENLSFVLPALEHGLDILCGNDGDCARS